MQFARSTSSTSMEGISVVVPTRNSEQTLPALLSSLAASSIQPLETILVDSESVDNTAAIGRSYGSQVVSIRCDRATARNIGARCARGRFLIFLDADMEVSNDTVRECLTRMRKADAVVIREKVVAEDGYWAQVRGFEKMAFHRSKYYEAARCIRTGFFKELGGYDSDLVGLEDMDLQARLLERGANIDYVDDSPLLHHEEGVGLIEYLKKRRMYSRADLRFKVRHQAFYAELSSPLGRARRLIEFSRTEAGFPALRFAPGLILMRTLEVLLRKSKPVRD